MGVMGHAAPAGQQRLGPSGGRCILCSSSMWFWGGSPRQALKGGEGGGGGALAPPGMGRVAELRRVEPSPPPNTTDPKHWVTGAPSGRLCIGNADPRMPPWAPPWVTAAPQPPWVPQDVLNAAALPEERVDDGGPLGHQGGFAEEGDDGEDAVEALEFGVAVGAEGDALTQLGQDGQVQDDGAGQQRVLRVGWGVGGMAGGVTVSPAEGCTPRRPRSPAPRTCCG